MPSREAYESPRVSGAPILLPRQYSLTRLSWKEDEELVVDAEEDVKVTWHHSLFRFVHDIKMIIEKDETFVFGIENRIRFKSF